MSQDGRHVCGRCGHLRYSHRSDGTTRMPCTAWIGPGVQNDVYCDCPNFEEMDSSTGACVRIVRA
jgi:hypothetical protein